jgi:hypothetical protein
MKFGFFRLQHRKLRRVESTFCKDQPPPVAGFNESSCASSTSPFGVHNFGSYPQAIKDRRPSFLQVLDRSWWQPTSCQRSPFGANGKPSEVTRIHWRLDSLASSWIHLASKQFLPGPTTNKAMAASWDAKHAASLLPNGLGAFSARCGGIWVKHWLQRRRSL